MKLLLALLLLFSTSIKAESQSLREALTKADTTAALKYIQAGANVNAPYDDGNGALIMACRWGDKDGIVGFLLRHGAKPDAVRSPKGRTALMVACAYYGGPSLVKQLVEAKASVNTTDKDGVTPLMLAAQNAKLGVVQYLISKGAKADAKDNKGATALDYVRRATELEYIKAAVKDDTIDQTAVIALLEKKK